MWKEAHRGNMKKEKQEQNMFWRVSPCVPLIFWLILWQGASVYVGVEMLLPSPRAVGEDIWAIFTGGGFWEQTWASCWRVLVGLGSGAVLGCFLGFGTYFSPLLRLLFAPWMKVVQSTPMVSFILLVLLWVPRTLVPSVVSGLMVIPLLWSAVVQGLTHRDEDLLIFGRMYGFLPWKMWKLVYMPSVFPYVFHGLHNGISLAWKSGVAAEVICQPTVALGTQLHRSKITLDTPKLFAWTVVVVVLSTCMERILKWVIDCLYRRKRV